MNSKFTNSPFFNVILFASFWALQIFISKLGFIGGAEIIPFSIQSAVVAFIFLTIYALPKGLKELKFIPKNVIIGLLIANAIHFGIGGFLSNAGIALTSAVNAGFLVQFAVVSTSVLAWTILKERITISRVIMVLLILTGDFFLTTKGRFIMPFIGDLFIILACISWSTGNILVRKTLRSTKVSGDIVSFLRPVAGLPVLLIFVLFAPIYPPHVREVFQENILDIKVPLLVILNGTFTAFLWIFLNRTLKIATASYMTLMGSLTPVMVAFLAIVFLKEKIEPVQLIGILFILSSTTIVQFLRIDKS